jgi:hypothetical protein
MASPSVLVLAGTKKPAKAKRQSRFLSLALAAFVKRPQAELKSALWTAYEMARPLSSP